MTTINMQAAAPSAPTGLTVTGAVGGATLKWNASLSPKDKYEVWYGTSNVLGSAALLATVDSNHYAASNLAASSSYWFWVRVLSGNGVYGAYTASAALTPQLAVTGNITANAVTTTTVSSASTSQASSISPYGALSNVSSLSFTGGGTPVIIMSNNPYSWVGTMGVPAQATYGIHSIRNSTAGGSDTNSGAKAFGTGTSLGGHFGPWTNIANAAAADGSFATATVDAGGAVDNAIFYNFDFSSVPVGATILNVQVDIKAKKFETGANTRIRVNLTTTASTDPAGASAAGTKTDWIELPLDGTNTVHTLGGSTTHQLGTWGPLRTNGAASRILTAADIRSANFGLFCDVAGYPGSVFYIDAISITVHYSTKSYALYEWQELIASENGDSRQAPFQLQYSFVPNSGDTHIYSTDWVTHRRGDASGADSLQAYSGRQSITLVELKR